MSNNIFYSHKFKNLKDETNEEYRNRLSTIANEINSIITDNNIYYIVLQELPSNSEDSTFFENIL